MEDAGINYEEKPSYKQQHSRPLTMLILIRALVGIEEGLQSVDPLERVVGGESEELRSKCEENSERENKTQENNYADHNEEWQMHALKVDVGVKEPCNGGTTMRVIDTGEGERSDDIAQKF